MEGKSLHWWLWFGIGNVIGFLAPLTITFALKEGQASWVFAVAMGSGFLLLQGALWMFYSEPFSKVQGLGAFLMAVGFILMNWGKSA